MKKSTILSIIIFLLIFLSVFLFSMAGASKDDILAIPASIFFCTACLISALGMLFYDKDDDK